VLHITPLERSALQMLANGKAATEIAGGLGLSERELEVHLTMLFARMGAATRTEAVDAAMRRGLLVDDAVTSGVSPE
jgi:two-component system, NarL family, nitrate/nitrite response regulator NarL